MAVIGTVAVVMMIREKQGRGSKKMQHLTCVAALALFYFLSRVIEMIPRNIALDFCRRRHRRHNRLDYSESAAVFKYQPYNLLSGLEHDIRRIDNGHAL